MPTFFALVVLGLQAYGQFAPLNRVAEALAIAALTVVIARLVLTFHDNHKLLETIRHDAVTDQLTQLGNRRRLLRELSDVTSRRDDRSPYVLALFDLDGFKGYNDSFGHPAGDQLLARLGERLVAAVDGVGTAHRLGGDEFCVLSSTADQSAGAIAARASVALSDEGEGFRITASSGSVMLPEEADTTSKALRLADERLYRDKSRRPTSANSQMRDLLVKTLHEREPQLGEVLHGIGQLVVSLGRAARLDAEQLDVTARAGELHDIGKMAIPDEVLRKPGPLSAGEWELMRQYTVIGERILNAAPLWPLSAR